MSQHKKVVFEGVATALITPFRDGEIDYAAFGALIDAQIASGIDALVVAGTTGEASTLTQQETESLFRFAAARIAGRVPLIAGVGSNSTAHALLLSRMACEVGCDALLLITPYYNKANDKGLIRHFLTVADEVDRPIILYNVPGRTGVNIPIQVYRELAKHERIVAVKEASGNVGAAADLAAACGDDLAIYAGNDDVAVPILSLGGKGVISVVSGILPAEMRACTHAARKGDFGFAAARQLALLPLIRALFCEVNPIPVKTAHALLGQCAAEWRLPLCEMASENRAHLIKVMHDYGLL